MAATVSHLPSPQSSDPSSSPRKRHRARREMSPTSEDELLSDSESHGHDSDDDDARRHAHGSAHGHGSDKRRKGADGTARRALEVKREKNRIKQRNLRERRANHVAELEQTVGRLQADVREHEARLASAGAREDALAGYARELERALVAAGRDSDAATLRRAWPVSALVRDRAPSTPLWAARPDDRDLRERERERATLPLPPPRSSRGSPESFSALLTVSAAFAEQQSSAAGPSRAALPYPTPVHEPIGAWPATRRETDYASRDMTTLPPLAPLRVRDGPPPPPPMRSPSYASSAPALSPALSTASAFPFHAHTTLPPLSAYAAEPHLHPHRPLSSSGPPGPPGARWSTLPPPLARAQPHHPHHPHHTHHTHHAAARSPAGAPAHADDATSPSRVSIAELCSPPDVTIKPEPAWPAEDAHAGAAAAARPSEGKHAAAHHALPPLASLVRPRMTDDDVRRASEISAVDCMLAPSRRESP